MAIGATYNTLFLVYVVLFSVSLFGLVLVLTFIGFTTPFAILTLIALWLTIILFRRFSESSTPLTARTVHA